LLRVIPILLELLAKYPRTVVTLIPNSLAIRSIPYPTLLKGSNRTPLILAEHPCHLPARPRCAETLRVALSCFHKAGDLVVIPAGTLHTVRTGAEPLFALTIMAPPDM
jgi:hypothetical protein